MKFSGHGFKSHSGQLSIATLNNPSVEIALRSNRPTEQQNQTETKNQQHDEIINNHNQHARNTTYTRSNTNTINRQEEQPKNLKHASIQQNEGGNSDQILAELIHEMQQVTMATENLKKNASIKC